MNHPVARRVSLCGKIDAQTHAIPMSKTESDSFRVNGVTPAAANRVEAPTANKQPKAASVRRSELSVGYAVTNADKIIASNTATGYAQTGPP